MTNLPINIVDHIIGYARPKRPDLDFIRISGLMTRRNQTVAQLAGYETDNYQVIHFIANHNLQQKINSYFKRYNICFYDIKFQLSQLCSEYTTSRDLYDIQDSRDFIKYMKSGMGNKNIFYKWDLTI